jgi:mRNA-degrading endonuclease RelE of RelBE toxin-antitoxin system
MNWVFDFADDAEQDLLKLPSRIRQRVSRTLQMMSLDPFAGDVKALHGPEWHGSFRRKLGSYRLIFSADQAQRKGLILRIVKRSKGTYR